MAMAKSWNLILLSFNMVKIVKHKDKLFWVAVFLSLYLTSFYNYLIFHTLTEMYSIVIAFGVFMFAWSSREFVKSHYFLYLGIMYLFVGFIDLMHTLSYKGMAIFPQYNSNLPTQLWIIARYIESISLFIATFFITKKVNSSYQIIAYIFVTSISLLSVFKCGSFPDCYIPGHGLTAFKKISEYVIIAILVLVAFRLKYKKGCFDLDIYNYIIYSLIFTVCSEITFTLYIGVYDFFNLLGHFFKLLSYYMIYKATIQTGLLQPFKLINKDLVDSKYELNKLSTAVEQSVDIVAITNRQGIIEYVNPAFEKLTGFSRNEAIGNTFKILTSGKHNRVFYQNLWDTILGGKVLTTTFINKKKNGGLYYEEKSVTPVLDSKGKVTHFISIGRDVTESKKVEFELISRSKELARSNEELEQFAYVASHDLQEPLRMVTNYTELLCNKYNGLLDQKAVKYTEYILEGTQRMRNLITDLLTLSRLSGKTQQFKLIDLNNVLKNVIISLKVSISETGAVIKYSTLPTVKCDGTQLTQVFLNLIGNAIKFRTDKPPEIEILAENISNKSKKDSYQYVIKQEHNPDAWVFCVKDNGIGIDRHYHEQIFNVFNRLHSKKEYEGSGIGLAICKKIVEKHKGKIWVESQLNEGSSFYFTLMANDNGT